MRQPEELKSDQPLLWSTGRGIDFWNLIQACLAGDLATVRNLIAGDPALVRSHYVIEPRCTSRSARIAGMWRPTSWSGGPTRSVC